MQQEMRWQQDCDDGDDGDRGDALCVDLDGDGCHGLKIL